MNNRERTPARVQPSRVLLKVSGEGLGSETPLDPGSIDYILGQIVDLRDDYGVQVALVVGGGNILRGAQQDFLTRTSGDYAGMVATIINGIALRDRLESMGVVARLQSALPVGQLAGEIAPDEAVESLENDEVVIFVGGTGNPYFTTDSAATIRAGQINADLILKGTNVRGAFTADPSHEDAEFIPTLSYDDLFQKKLRIIDLTAARIGQEAGIPMVIFDLFKEGALFAIVQGEEVGSYIYPEAE
ncbi:uridine monophosphate kinase [Candidatus Bipolaricaulota bacterium]|nr:uridine monophosphate kinase [Candidatus Bipolaricaulota bacterium]